MNGSETEANKQSSLNQLSARSLVNLYTVIIGASLTYSLAVLIDPLKGIKSVSTDALLLFLAYLTTLFPFYHGALRHLDDAYFENTSGIEKQAVLIFDFFLLFVHALGFVVLSTLLKIPSDFSIILLIVLLIDVVWGILTYLGSDEKKSFNASAKWASLNFVSVLVGGAYLVTHSITFGAKSVPQGFAFLVLVFAVLRTLADYKICGCFYFPRSLKQT